MEVNGIPNAMLLEMITLALIRHGVPLSLLEDEDLSKVLNHVLGISPGTDYIYNSVAFPMEQKMTSYVCFAQRSHHSIAFLVKYADNLFRRFFSLSASLIRTTSPLSSMEPRNHILRARCTRCYWVLWTRRVGSPSKSF